MSNTMSCVVVFYTGQEVSDTKENYKLQLLIIKFITHLVFRFGLFRLNTNQHILSLLLSLIKYILYMTKIH